MDILESVQARWEVFRRDSRGPLELHTPLHSDRPATEPPEQPSLDPALPFLPDPTKRAHICHECDEWSPVNESKPTGKGVCDLIQAKQDALRRAGKPCGCPGHLTRMAQAGSASCPDGKF